MKNFAKYIVCAVIALGMTSCIASHFEDNTFCRDAELCLTFTDGSTRAAGDHDGQGNDDTYNEDKLVSAQIFLYPTGGTDSNAVFTYRMANLGNDRFGKVNVKTSISAGQLAQLFPNGATTCDAYVVANYDTDLTMATDTRVATLKATALSTPSFVKTTSIADRPATPNMSPIQIAEQPSFVMDSEGATVTKTGTTVTGDIHLTRAASKIRIFVELGEISNNDDTWSPNASAMTVLFRNCSTEGKIDDNSDNATVDATTLKTLEQAVYFNIPDLGGGTATPGTSAVTRAGETKRYTTYTPFYSYASCWVEDFKADDAAYLTLNIPWVKASNDAIALYSYDVPINDIMKLERNKYYIVNIKVGVLGDLETIDEATYEYLVLDWKNEPIDVSLENPRYLVVNEHNYEMDNVTELHIPFSSSNDCMISAKLCVHEDFNSKTNVADPTPNDFSVEVDNERKIIIVKNGLDNNLFLSSGSINNNFDFTKYTITLTICHKNDDGTANSTYSEDITITQYPAVYGEKKVNSMSNNYGGVFVNGGSPGNWDPSNYTCFAHASGTASSNSVSSDSMFVITVSSTEGTGYVIGDPRTATPLIPAPYDSGQYVYANAPRTYVGSDGSTSGTLTNYYPALSDGKKIPEIDQTKHPTYNMLAPKFRICSGYGAVPANSSQHAGPRADHDNMVGRCATYQEDGYPAGRWRLPTAAELRFVNTLANAGKIPALFSTQLFYWCAHGRGRYSDGKFTLVETGDDSIWYSYDSVSVRCVYDEWYWGSDQIADKTKFTWGDEPRPTATAK